MEHEMKKPLLILLAAALAAGAARADTIEMKVYGLVCGFCAQGIDKTLRKNPATADVFVSLENQLVAVATMPGKDIGDAELRKALTDSGYDVKAITRTQRPLDEVRASLGRKP
jgi:copper chaperone CopZ